MKVFISWSGERSKLVAELLDNWIQCVIQAVDPWMSSKDIDRGALWFTEISDQLANTSIGIVCLTKENKNKPWILFEAGALAKGLSSNRVCTFLIDISPTDLENPLAQFNHTFPTRDSIWELVRTINITLKEMSLKESILAKVFDTYWVQFERDFNYIISNSPEAETSPKRKDNDVMLDVLSTVRMLDKRLRTIEFNSEKSQIDHFSPITNAERNSRNIPFPELRMSVRNLIAHEVSDQLILDSLSEKYGYPREVIRREIIRGRNIRVDEDEKK